MAVPRTTPGTTIGIRSRLASGPRRTKLRRARQSAAGTPSNRPTAVASMPTRKESEKPSTNFRWSRIAANQRSEYPSGGNEGIS